MKLWSKGFEPDKMIERFTVGNDRELDLRLARYDVQGSMAHIRMLESIGLLGKDELDKLLKALGEIAEVIERGEFVIEDGVDENGEPREVPIPIEFDVSLCTIILWEV